MTNVHRHYHDWSEMPPAETLGDTRPESRFSVSWHAHPHDPDHDDKVLRELPDRYDHLADMGTHVLSAEERAEMDRQIAQWKAEEDPFRHLL